MPCPYGLQASRIPARRWATRADLLACLERARQVMESNPAGRESLAQLAAVAGLSPHHFNRLYRLAYGRAPIRHRQEMRLRLGETLSSQGVSVGHAAWMAGYTSLPTYCRLRRRFRKIG